MLVHQLQWSLLSLLSTWLVTHWPEVRVVQVVLVFSPPQMVLLSIVWPHLSAGSEGSTQLFPVMGLNTSTLVPEPLPPDSKIPFIDGVVVVVEISGVAIVVEISEVVVVVGISEVYMVVEISEVYMVVEISELFFCGGDL